MKSEVTAHADFSAIRYAQCWEDADILVEALDVANGRRCLSIASAGDNALALLAAGAEHVVALDLSPAQLACVELRVAAYKRLKHQELLELIGSRPSQQRDELYKRCRPLLSQSVQQFWDIHNQKIKNGIGGAGKFEHYFYKFKKFIIPLIHNQRSVNQLLKGGTKEERLDYYENIWNTWRWRLLFKIFFSRYFMGKMGRDPVFFRYVEGSVATHILKHTRYALTELDPADNPYLNWILTGTHGNALPYALRKENFEKIRQRLDHFEWHLMSIEEYLEKHPEQKFDAFNLSDIFEYMSEENYQTLLNKLILASNPGARLAYWNMLVPRHRPDSMQHRLKSLDSRARKLYEKDKAFFYMDFVIEETT